MFKVSSMRTHACSDVREHLVSESVEIAGWVQSRRDHGGVVFLDVRDRSGVVQVVFDPIAPHSFAVAEKVRVEYVLKIKGMVRLRPEGTINPQMQTGRIEMVGEHVEILNRSEPVPFPLDEYAEVGEETRLKYRYLDLRRILLRDRLMFRARVTSLARNYLEEMGLIDIETPILTKATPEGARDYLVPSRTHQGSFFALPQSPQLFKQLLMMAGFEGYYQIAKCFRDEDLRADRQPEFTQIDIEASFVNAEDIMRLAEGMIRKMFSQLLSVELPVFPRMTYYEAMEKYGVDKPDLRNPLQLVTVSDLVKESDFRVFSNPAVDAEGRVAALCVHGAGDKLSRKEIDQYTQFVGIYGAKGLAYIKYNEKCEVGRDGLQSPIVKNLSDEALAGIIARTGAQPGDIIFFGADKEKVVNESLGALRNKIGQDLNLMSDQWAPLWVVDFPMFEKEASGRWAALHHPFTAPKSDLDELKRNPGAVVSQAYDMVLNGVELGGGSIRIHDSEVQSTVFDLLQINAEAAQEKFGFLLDALKFGCPPHGGLAFGLDRLVMLMCGAKSIREVIAFPKTQSAACLLTDAPSTVEPQQLRDLGIRVRVEEKKL